ncbi:MAG: FMN-binding negative transcriptional regulator [Rhodospirillales bacterium]|nr:FMN-binding negative transcriptional regulator [Rhodospirillales bacterium]
MYIPSAFASPSDEATARLIDEFGFAVLVACGAGGVPVVSHVPLLHDRQRNVLIGHLAGPNPQAEILEECARAGREVLAVFQGPHGYISPSWYAAKHNSVPTWNYAAAHVYGVPATFSSPDRLRAIVDSLAKKYERMGWTLAAQDEDYVARMLGGIVGFEIAIARIEGKFKMSQNRNAADRAGVLAGLEATGRADDAQLARAMRAGKPA